MPNDSKNTILFIVIAMAMLLVYQMFVLEPAAKRRQAETRAQAAAVQAQQPAAGAAAQPGVPGAAPVAVELTREQALARAPRIAIDTSRLDGSISLAGARIDDLSLKTYRETMAANSPPVQLFRPQGTKGAYFADFGWTGANLPGLPDAQTVWTRQGAGALTPANPVVLTYRSPQGLVFTRKIEVDQNYMFTITDTAANYGAAPVTIAPYARVQRHGLPDLAGNQVVHEGAVAVADGKLKLFKYKAWKKKNANTELASTGGWFGITDKFWLGAVIPDQSQPVRGSLRVTPSQGLDIYDASFLGGYKAIAPGRQVTVTNRLFAGAKTVPVLKGYEDNLGIAKFDQAVDWGMFWFLTRPIFSLLHVFYTWIGNFGLAIMLLTVAVKLLFFYPANKSYESLTKMKKVQPELEKIKKKHKDDPAKQQQAMMQLYQQEKINPFMGCLPILIQIPVFYALYKVLSVTIEMRHAPFFGWIQDLSARDPTTIWNLFGLLPFDPAMVPMIGTFLNGPLHIGVWPLLMGFSMWMSQSMSPTTGMDPIQARIMQFFPVVFTFMLAPFAAGLVIYWTWNNLLSVAQQYAIMRRYKVETGLDILIRKLRSRGAAASG